MQKNRLNRRRRRVGSVKVDIDSLRWHYPVQIDGQQWIDLLSQPDSSGTRIIMQLAITYTIHKITIKS